MIAVAAVAAAAAATFAWLGVNRDLNSNNMVMDINDGMFELGVPAENGVKSTTVADTRWVPAIESEYGVITPAMLERFFNDSTGYGREESNTVTGNNKTGVICTLDVEGEEKSLRPGSTGTLTFIIYPKTEDLVFEATLSLSALGKRLVGSSVVYERLDDSIDDSDPPDPRAPALHHLKGHILFFTERTDPAEPDGEYTYDGWIMPGETFGIEGASGTNTAGYSVTLYWEWPITNSRLRELLGSEEVEGERKNNYYYYDAETDTTEMNATGYNNADTEIGKHISHIAAEFDVSLCEDCEGMTAVTAQEIE